MRGYIAVVSGRAGSYNAEVVGLPGCAARAPTVEQAIHAAKEALRRWQDAGKALPAPRPSQEMVTEVMRRRAIAGACLFAPSTVRAGPA